LQEERPPTRSEHGEWKAGVPSGIYGKPLLPMRNRFKRGRGCLFLINLLPAIKK
jgi:hypothetical protein